MNPLALTALLRLAVLIAYRLRYRALSAQRLFVILKVVR